MKIKQQFFKRREPARWGFSTQTLNRTHKAGLLSPASLTARVLACNLSKIEGLEAAAQ
jgi:hypothetical protein